MSDVLNIEVLQEGEVAPEEMIQEIVTGDNLEMLTDYLKGEYDTAKSEMDPRNQKLIKWRKNMEAIAADAPKNNPFKGSSNVTIPVTQMITQSLVAKVLGSFDAREPLWDIQSLRSDEADVKRFKTVGKYLNLLAKSPTDLNMEQALQDLVYETVLSGGSFPKVTWTIEKWRVKTGADSDQEIVLHDGPEVIVMPLEKVKYRRGIGKISRLPWIAIDTPLTEVELRKRVSDGIYPIDAVEIIIGDKRTSPDELEEQAQRAETFDSGETTPLYDISEFWVYWDIDGSGVPVDLFITMHVPSGTVLKQQYNMIGMRSIVNSKFVHRPNSLTGRGTGQMTESSQDEVTSIHNMRNDNMKIANMKMFAVKRTGAFKNKEEIYPGKTIVVDNPREDFIPIQMGEVYPSSLQAENQSMSYAQRAVGLSDTQMGFADQTMKSRDTVRGQAMRVQQGDSVLSGAVMGLRTVLSQVGMLVWIQCVANKDRVMARERLAKRLTDEELNELEEALNITVPEVPMRMAFLVKVTDAERTFEQQRMNMMTMTQLFGQFSQQSIPLAMQLYSPQGTQMKQQAPELYNFMGRLLTGNVKMMENIFRFFDIQNTKDYLPDSVRMDQTMEMMEAALSGMQGMPNLGMEQPGIVAGVQEPGMGAPVGPVSNAPMGAPEGTMPV